MARFTLNPVANLNALAARNWRWVMRMAIKAELGFVRIGWQIKLVDDSLR